MFKKREGEIARHLSVAVQSLFNVLLHWCHTKLAEVLQGLMVRTWNQPIRTTSDPRNKTSVFSRFIHCLGYSSTLK